MVRGVAVGIAVLLAISALAGYYVGMNTSPTRSTTYTTTQTATTSSATTLTSTTTTTFFFPNLGSYLSLSIQLNATMISPRGSVEVDLILSNPLNSNLTATVPQLSNSTFALWDGLDFFCGGGTNGHLFSFALFPGVYDQGNLTLANNPLNLVPPLFPSCPVSPQPLYLVFQPHSDSAEVYLDAYGLSPLNTSEIASTMVCMVSFGGTSCGASSGLFGYWNGTVGGHYGGNFTTSSPDFHYFSPGQYTIVAEDAWGHVAFEYFKVV